MRGVTLDLKVELEILRVFSKISYVADLVNSLAVCPLFFKIVMAGLRS